MMALTLNGEPYTHNGDGSLSALLAEIGAADTRVAVMIDGSIIPIDDHAIISLHAGSHVEIMTYAAGG
jgi:thiamine biosynthesis protein ThiS